MANRPPVIPEIVKAYQNDPRTKLAVDALAAGSSTAPVAAGKYAYADGIARVLQGVTGAYVDKQQQKKYGAEEATLLAQRAQRGADGLTGLQAPAPAPTAAPAIAAALGAPAPVQPAPMPATGSMTPPLAGLGAAPAMGGGVPARAPFGQGSPGAANPAPTPEIVPDAPTAIARPNAPDAVGAGQSRTLRAAYEIMKGANPYESAQGQDLYGTGLTEQTKLDESAAERKQRLADMGYESDLSAFREGASQDRSNTYAERREAQGRNFTADQNYQDRTFKASESGKDRAQRTWETQFDARTKFALQRSSQAFEAGQGDKNRQNALDIKGMDRSDAGRAAGQRYLSTKDGQKFQQAQFDALNNASGTLATLGAFEKRLGQTKRTGGVLLSAAPGAVRWANTDYQVLSSLSNQLSLSLAKDMKGSLSDKDVAFLQQMVPSIRNNKGANKEQIQFMRGVAQRQQDYAIARMRAVEEGQGGSSFGRNWAAYVNSAPVTSGTSYDKWLNSRPKFDANGNPVK